MNEKLDKNIKNLLEKAPDPQPWQDGAPDRIFDNVQNKLKDEEKPKPVKQFRWIAAAAVAAIVIAVLFIAMNHKTTEPGVIAGDPDPKPGAPEPTTQTVIAAALTTRTLSDGSELAIAEGSELKVVPGNDRPLIKLQSGAVTCTVAKREGRFRVSTEFGDVIALGTIFSVDLRKGDGMQVTVSEGEVIVRETNGNEMLAVAGETLSCGNKASQELVENWRSGQLVPKLEDGSQGKPLEVRTHNVTISVKDQVALVEVDQTFYNPQNQRIEGTFFFPLPHGATIARLAMYVGDSLMEGEIAEAQRARRTFEALKVQRIDPALLEWAGGNNFKMRVFPIEPESEKRVLISYFQVLRKDQSTVRLSYPLASDSLNTHPVGKIGLKINIESTPKIRDTRVLSYDAEIDEKPNKVSVSYDVEKLSPSKDFVLEYDVAAPHPEVVMAPYWHAPKNEGYFMMLLSPQPTEEIGSEPRLDGARFVFIVDKSGGLGMRHLKLGVQAVKDALSMLQPDDVFSIVAYDTGSKVFSDQLVKVNRLNVERAKGWLDGLDAFGAADIASGWKAAAKLAGDQKSTVVYIGNGMSSLSSTKSARLVAEAEAAFAGSPVRIHALPVGSITDLAFLNDLARTFDGTCRPIQNLDDVGYSVPELMEDYAWPVLKDIQLSVSGVDVHEIYPTRLPNVSIGRQLLVFGMYKAPGQGKLNLHAQCRGVSIDKSYDLNFSGDKGPQFVPRMWAKTKIDELQKRLAFGGDTSVRNEVVELSKRYKVMSQFTSFIVLESAEDYLRYGIERRRNEFGDETDEGWLEGLAKLDANKSKEQAGESVDRNSIEGRMNRARTLDQTVEVKLAETSLPRRKSARRFDGRGGGADPLAMDDAVDADGIAPPSSKPMTSAGESDKSFGYMANAKQLNETDVLPWHRKDIFPTFGRNKLGKWPKGWKHSDKEALELLQAVASRLTTFSASIKTFDCLRDKEVKKGRTRVVAFDRKTGRYFSRDIGDDRIMVSDGRTCAELYPLLKYAAKRNVEKEDLLALAHQFPALLVPWPERLDWEYHVTIQSQSDSQTVLKLLTRNRSQQYQLVFIENGVISKIEWHSRTWNRGKQEWKKTQTVQYEWEKPQPVKGSKSVMPPMATVIRTVSHLDKGDVVTRVIRLNDVKVNQKLDDSLFAIEIPTDWTIRDLDLVPTGNDVRTQSPPVNPSPNFRR